MTQVVTSAVLGLFAAGALAAPITADKYCDIKDYKGPKIQFYGTCDGQPKELCELFTDCRGIVARTKDIQRRKAVKTIAIVSVFGPKEIRQGFGSAVIPQKAILDHAGERLADGFSTGGVRVIPAAAVQKIFAEEFEDAYFPLYYESRKKAYGNDWKKVAKDEESLRLRTRSEMKTAIMYDDLHVHSSNTPRIHAASGGAGPFQDVFGEGAAAERPRYLPEFLATVGALTQKLGADAFLLVNARAGKYAHSNEQEKRVGFYTVRGKPEFGSYAAQRLDLGLYSSKGENIYSDTVVAISPHSVGSGFKLSVSPDAFLHEQQQTVNIAVNVALAHYGIDLATVPPREWGYAGKYDASKPTADAAKSSETRDSSKTASAPASGNARFAGTYLMKTVMGKTPPHEFEGVTYHDGSLAIRDDGTYTSIITSGGSVNGRPMKPKAQKQESTYNVDGNVITFEKPKGGGFLARLLAPMKGEIGDGKITIYYGSVTLEYLRQE